MVANDYIVRLNLIDLSYPKFAAITPIKGDLNATTPEELGKIYANHNKQAIGSKDYCVAFSFKPDFDFIILGETIFKVERMSRKERKRFVEAMVVQNARNAGEATGKKLAAILEEGDNTEIGPNFNK